MRLAGLTLDMLRAATGRNRNAPTYTERYERALHHLWRGLSRPASAILTGLAHDPGCPRHLRVQACLEMATWLTFLDQPRDALAILLQIDRIGLGFRGGTARWMREGFLRLETGDVDGALKAFRKVRSSDPNARLALGNCAPADDDRLAAINAVLERSGLQPLERIDRSRALGLANIRAAAPSRAERSAGRVSVLVPAFNAERCLDVAIRSLLAQSYEDLEILIIDDASTDGTFELAKSLARTDARIRVLRHDKNRGAYPARNTGLSEATGAFVTTHDVDDWSHPEKIARQVGHLSAHPGTAGVCTHWVRVRETLHVTRNWRLGRRVIFPSHSSFLVRRAVLDAVGPWDPVRVGADAELMGRIGAVHGDAAIAYLLPEAPLAFALDDSGSLTRTRQTHVSSVRYGLRQVYHAVWSHDHRLSGGVGPDAAARRLGALPREMLERTQGPAEFDELFLGDATDPSVMAAMLVEVLRLGDGCRIGVFHWPDLAAPPRGLCDAYCALIGRENVTPVLPGAQVRLARRFPVAFSDCSAEADDPPRIL